MPSLRLLALLLLLSLAGCASAPDADLRLSYTVAAEPEEIEVTVDVVAGRAPRIWKVGTSALRRVEAFVPREEGEAGEALRGKALELKRGRVRLPEGVTRIRYRYPILAAVERRGHHSLRTGAGQRGSYSLEGAAYLLRPAELMSRSRARLVFRGSLAPHLPWSLSPKAPTFSSEPQTGGAPAPAAGDEAASQPAVELDAQDLINLGHHGFGLERHVLRVSGGILDVGIVAGPVLAPREVVLAWLTQAAKEVALVRPDGRFPNPRNQVILVPAPGSQEVAPFGRVLYSRPKSVAIYVGERAPPAEFRDDWTAVHELLHLSHPRVDPSSSWFSEGIATYYQCMVRIRSGRRSAVDMWGSMAWGLEHGLPEAQGLTLRELADRMHELHAYRGVYWGGAFFALALDVELRRRSKGVHGLGSLLAPLTEGEGRVKLAEVARAVDAAGGAGLWRELMDAHLNQPTLSAGAELFKRLGVEVDGRGDVSLNADASDADLRLAIERSAVPEKSSGHGINSSPR